MTVWLRASIPGFLINLQGSLLIGFPVRIDDPLDLPFLPIIPDQKQREQNHYEEQDPDENEAFTHSFPSLRGFAIQG